ETRARTIGGQQVVRDVLSRLVCLVAESQRVAVELQRRIRIQRDILHPDPPVQCRYSDVFDGRAAARQTKRCTLRIRNGRHAKVLLRVQWSADDPAAALLKRLGGSIHVGDGDV